MCQLKTAVSPTNFASSGCCQHCSICLKPAPKLFLIGHIGRDPKETLKPIYDVLAKDFKMVWAGALTGDKVVKLRNDLKSGQILMLENVRSDEREKVGDDSLARELAALGEFYVDDAFAVAHRAHASVVGIPKYLPSYAGLNFITEIPRAKRCDETKAPFLIGSGWGKG